MIKVVRYNCSCGYSAYDEFEGQFSRRCLKCNDPITSYVIKYNPKTRKSEFCNIDGMIKENPRYSISGAVLDEDLANARKVHPGREFKKFGNSWRPLIRNRQDKLKYMKECGAFEY